MNSNWTIYDLRKAFLGRETQRRYWGAVIGAAVFIEPTVITNGTFKSVSYSLLCVLRDHVPPEAIVIPPITDQ